MEATSAKKEVANKQKSRWNVEVETQGTGKEQTMLKGNKKPIYRGQYLVYYMES